jgi:hypothetical protein
MKSKLLMKIFTCLLIMNAASSLLLGQTATHPWYVLDNGGGNATTVGSSLQSSIGTLSGIATSTNGAILESGYLRGVRMLSGATSSLDVASDDGWNMISIPFIVADFRKSILYPAGITKAYNFHDGYQTYDTLSNGSAYWIKFAGAGTSHFTGRSIFRDTIILHEGWNMVGCISYAMPAAVLLQLDSTTLITPYWNYTSGVGYSFVDTLRPGKGYWVKVRKSGRLVLKSASVMSDPLMASAVSMSPRQAERFTLANDAGTLTVRDAQGRERKLYFAPKSENMDHDKWECPPVPFEGMMDVRYASNRVLESEDALTAKDVGVRISSAEYPLTLFWHSVEKMKGARLQIQDREMELDGDGETRVVESTARIAIIFAPPSRPEIPATFALYQNYPNPFNPTTTIRYDLPAKSIVSLKLYNVLGQEVATLIDGLEEAGYKKVEWSASGTPSGVYFYRIEIRALEKRERVVDVRKLILVK